MKIEIIRNILSSKIRIFNAHLMRITLNIIRKNTLEQIKNMNPNVTKIKKIQKKYLNFAPKIALNPDYYWNSPVSQTCHKPVTNQSQMCHKPVTNQSQISHKKGGFEPKL